MPDSISAAPQACSLTAPAAAARAERWRTLLAGGLLEAGPLDGGARLTFRDDSAIAAEVDALIAAERECCPFLKLTVARAGERLVLDVVGPSGD